MSIYISVVSHQHDKLINALSCLSALSDKCTVVVKSNVPNESFEELNLISGFHWIDEQYYCGFGHNNNINYNYCVSHLDMKDDDYFIVLNPDVLIEYQNIECLINEMKENDAVLSAINLFIDNSFKYYDFSIRTFPKLSQFTKSFLGLGNNSILDKSQIYNPIEVDWAAGSFLAFKAEHYKRLRGFDENYFMYCEDIDICYRSSLLGKKVIYFPNIKAQHLAKHENRRFFSKHFYYHVKSVIRFISKTFGFKKNSKSSLIT